MPTKTKAAPTWAEPVLDITILFSTAVTLIQKRRRNRAMTDRLIRALQLFLDNSLGTVSSLTESLDWSLLSSEISSSPHIGPPVQAYFARKGIRYLGEAVHYLEEFLGQPRVAEDRQAHEAIKVACLAHGFQESDFAEGVLLFWSPPYWTDRALCDAAYRQPIGNIFLPGLELSASRNGTALCHSSSAAFSSPANGHEFALDKNWVEIFSADAPTFRDRGDLEAIQASLRGDVTGFHAYMFVLVPPALF